MAGEKPLVHAVVMCDYVHQDRASGKFTLLGTFNRINIASEFPVNYGPIGIYVSLSHWTKDQALTIQVVRNSIELIGRLPPIHMPKHDPNDSVHFPLNLPPIPLPAPGRYGIQVLVGDEILHEFTFPVNDLTGMADKKER